jgi:Mg2+-importing ATPase
VSDPGLGITGAEARELRIKDGPNDPGRSRVPSALHQAVALLVNPLVLVLVVAAGLSAFLGQRTDTVVIAVIVSLSLTLNFIQTYRSQRAADALRGSITPTATVRRDGKWQEIPRLDVVRGDAIRLCAGDLVPADARLVEAHDLHVQESAMTGESLPSEKSAGATVFLGTSVVSGVAVAVVTAIGRNTQFGDIVSRLAAKPPESEFERGIRRFGMLIVRVVFVLVLFILAGSLLAKHDAFESLLFAVALAVGLTPEFLPMITTVTLSSAAVRMAREKVIVKNLSSIQNLGSIDVLCCDKTGTLTRGEMALERAVDPFGAPSARPTDLARINSTFETGIRSPLDAALLAGAPELPHDVVKVDEIPFDFERRRLSIVANVGTERILITKGAPESMLAIVTSIEEGGTVRPLTDDDKARCEAVYRAMGADGYRVLAVAQRPVARAPAYGMVDERELCLAGFLAFSDPPLPDAREMIAALARDGVRVVILTGDNELVSQHVGSQVGIDDAAVLGTQIDRMTDSALGQVAERTTLFARLSPAQKSRVLLALRRRGHVVGYLGDGINDAPCLHAADVGIAPASGADIARDAADMILLERSLRVLHAGILEGRRAFGNVTKYLLMGTSSNFGNMLSMAAAALVLPFLPMLPTQILLNNLLYDLAQVTIPSDRVDAEYLETPQRWDIRSIRNFMLLVGPVSSLYDFLTFFILLRVFHADEALFHTGWFIESLATQTLVLLVIRTRGSVLRSRPSLPLAATIAAVLVVAISLPFTPLARPLGFSAPPAAFLAFVAVASLTYLALVEAVKRVPFLRASPTRA